MPVKKETMTKKKEKVKEDTETAKPKAAAKKSGYSVPVYSLLGNAAGSLDLPKEIFGAKVNSALLAQAVRVYSTNERSHHAHTKTRGEVSTSTAKIWRQKGTGRARHGARSAPIFVGGGVALGPRKRDVRLDMPQKMRAKALVSALADKFASQQVLGVSGLEKATGKTNEMAKLVGKISPRGALFVSDKPGNVTRAVKNLKSVEFLTADQLNAYEVISCKNLVLTKEAVAKLQERL